MSYDKEHIDHLFYRIREILPNNSKFYYVIVILKILPILLQIHSSGLQKDYALLTNYYKFFSFTFYFQNSIGLANIIPLISIILILNIYLASLLLYYVKFSELIYKIDINFGSKSSLNIGFSIFSFVIFFKYIMLNQIFNEINFLPLLCNTDFIDYEKVVQNKILVNFSVDSLNVCQTSNLYYMFVISFFNFLLDMIMHYYIVSRLFDFNILSDYFWNCYPNLFHSYLYLESYGQIFFILFLFYKNNIYFICFSVYYYILIFIYIVRYFNKKEFFTLKSKGLSTTLEFFNVICFISHLIVVTFHYGYNQYPSDANIILMMIFELLVALTKYYFSHKNDFNNIASLLNLHYNNLNERNIYPIISFLCIELKIFTDLNSKFTEESLDLFLNNYIFHLKSCESTNCVCRKFLKKAENGSTSQTLKINSSFIQYATPSGIKEEYIINKFFNFLTNNSNSDNIKHTNNINFIQMKDDIKQKYLYSIRVKLIELIKKLVFFRMQTILNLLETSLSNNFSSYTKHFIRINSFALKIICDKSYYKTLFQFYEFTSNQYLKYGKSYKTSNILYYYMKNFCIQEYNNFQSYMKISKKDNLNIDFRKIVYSNMRLFDIEERLLKSVKEYYVLLQYFSNEVVQFTDVVSKVRSFKKDYKEFTQYIKYFFKDDKINNLFICSKIILLYKVLNFSIPNGLQNKLIIQTHEVDDQKTSNSMDSNYYMIIYYNDGEFKMKYLSHELLVILEYSHDELKNKDFQILMPEVMREIHKNLLIHEIKSKSNHAFSLKEIFFVSKKRCSVLFDLHYKILLNMSGEITLLAILSLKKQKNDFKTCFLCLDDKGDVLSINKEFEEYFVITMKILEYVKLDGEKIFLQGFGESIRSYFMEEENKNSEFFQKFDYELYLTSLFEEEFEPLKDKNESLYQKKYSKWFYLKEILKRSKYNRFIDFYCKLRIINEQKFFFIKIFVSSNFTSKSVEPCNTTLSLINAVKVSKREMAKLSVNKIDETESKNPNEIPNELKINENKNFVPESQSILSSAASAIKDQTSKKVFRSKKSLQVSSKSKNIIILTVLLGILSFMSILFNFFVLLRNNANLEYTYDLAHINMEIVLLKSEIFSVASNIISLGLYIEELINDYNDPLLPRYENNLMFITETNLKDLASNIYKINYWNNKYYPKEVFTLISTINNEFMFIFDNGMIYKKNDKSLNIYDEICSIHDKSYDFFMNFKKKYSKSDSYVDFNIKEYLLFEKVRRIISTKKKFLSENDITFFHYLNNIFSQVDPYTDEMKKIYENYYVTEYSFIRMIITLFIALKFIFILAITISEYFFITIGYSKVKKKIKSLKGKFLKNNLDKNLKKIEEYTNFSNTFNVYSLYNVADFEIVGTKKNEQQEKLIMPRKKTKGLISGTNVSNSLKMSTTLQTFGLKDNNIDEESNIKNQLTLTLKNHTIKNQILEEDEEIKLKESEEEMDLSYNKNNKFEDEKLEIKKNVLDTENDDSYINLLNGRNEKRKSLFPSKTIKIRENEKMKLKKEEESAHDTVMKKIYDKTKNIEEDDLPPFLQGRKNYLEAESTGKNSKNSSNENDNNEKVTTINTDNKQLKMSETKKKGNADNKPITKRNILKEFEENIQHKNSKPKLILLLFLSIFITIYLSNYLYDMFSIDIFNQTVSYSEILLSRYNVLNMLIYRYKISIINNSTQDDLSYYTDKVENMIYDIIEINKKKGLDILHYTSQIEEHYNSIYSCDKLSEGFSNLFNTDKNNELIECQRLGNGMNSNGLAIAYKNTLNTMKFLLTDMKRMKSLTEESLISKLKDYIFYTVIQEIEYTFSKYNILLTESLNNDISWIIWKIDFLEKAFSYSSIFFNFLFTIISIIFIIAPIKIVENIISWLLNKLNKI